MDTDYTSDSDVSEDTRELVNQGLASARRKRAKLSARPDTMPQRRLVPNTDISSVRHQMLIENSIDAALTHDLNQSGRIIGTSPNHNILPKYTKADTSRNQPQLILLPTPFDVCILKI